MMQAYQPQPGVHQGLPHGHPGMTPTPAQHVAQPMQMMPDVSGPGGSHVSQAGAMVGIQPAANGMEPGSIGGHLGGPMVSMGGGNPSAHALSHLTPQMQMMQQQQQQNMHAAMQQNTPLAMQHQQMVRQRQIQVQAIAQAQAQANGIVGMDMQPGGMQLMPQQMVQMQHNNPNFHPGNMPQLPQHLQQQQFLLRQQQNQQAAMQNQLAIQQANSQTSNQGQPGPQNQPGQPGQPGQMRPHSRMANSHQQNQITLQQHQQQNLQGDQAQQHPPQTSQPPNSQQSSTPQQAQAAHMQQQQRLAMMRQQQVQAQRMAAQAQIQAQAQAQSLQSQMGSYILKLMLFSEQLSAYNAQTGKDLASWEAFVQRHFSDNGKFLHTLYCSADSKTFEIQVQALARYFYTWFDTGAQNIRLHVENPRENSLQNGVHQVSCLTARLDIGYNNGLKVVMSGSLTAMFAPGTDRFDHMEFNTLKNEEFVARDEIARVLQNRSPTMVQLTKSPKMSKTPAKHRQQQKMQPIQSELKLEDFPKAPVTEYGVTSRVKVYLEMNETFNFMGNLVDFSQENPKLRPEQALDQYLAQIDKEYNIQNMNGGHAMMPQQSQQSNASQQQQHQRFNAQAHPQISLPPNGVGPPQLPTGAQTPGIPTIPNTAHHMGGGPGGPIQHHNFSSPSLYNLNLPMHYPNGSALQMNMALNGSPHISTHPALAPHLQQQQQQHTPSPAQTHMAAPQMVPQHSQQGTNSSAASANTSPSVNNKRRRSTVKIEADDTGGGEGVNGAAGAGQQAKQRVKASPRVGGGGGSKKGKAG